jgi:ATP-dependent exoDNAse (exonuclease V) alpha subunit
MILRLTAPLRQRESIAPPHRAAKVPDIKIATFNVNGVQNRLNPTAETRASNASAGPSVLATRSCRSRTITTRTVYNGDLGVVSGMDMEEGELSVDFDSREVTYGSGELDELVLAYATTIHKSQGSEYPAVVMPLSTQHYPMLQRNLVYTGVTRGKRLVVLVGERKALAIAVKGSRTRRRWSKLREWLVAINELQSAGS